MLQVEKVSVFAQIICETHRIIIKENYKTHLLIEFPLVMMIQLMFHLKEKFPKQTQVHQKDRKLQLTVKQKLFMSLILVIILKS